MQRTELEDFILEALGEEMPNLSIETTEDGQIIIYTGLAEDAEGDVIDFEDFDAEYNNSDTKEEKEDDDEEDDNE